MAGSGSGVQTFTVSQSSPMGASITPVRPWNPDSCGGGGPKAKASRVPSQAVTGRGAANRASPTGGSANGMPRKTTSPSSRRPRTAPAWVRTTLAPTDVTTAPWVRVDRNGSLREQRATKQPGDHPPGMGRVIAWMRFRTEQVGPRLS